VPWFRVNGLARSPDGQFVLLAADALQKDALFVGLSESGPGEKILLPPISASDLHLAAGPGETLWIAGTTNYRRTMFNSTMSDAYLMRLDRAGNIAWERAFGNQTDRSILELAPVRDDVVVIGSDDENLWLARISADGKIVWQKTFGSGSVYMFTTKASVTVSDGNIMVAAFDAIDQEPPSEQGRLTLWRFDEAGNLLDRRKIEERVAQSPAPLRVLQLMSAREAGQFYVFSGWPDFPASGVHDKSRRGALTVTKLTDKAEILWRRELPDTLVSWHGHAELCYVAATTLVNGNAMVSCSMGLAGSNDESVNIFELESETGTVTSSWEPMKDRPNCKQAGGTPLFVVQRAATAPWLLGNGSGCVWLDQLRSGSFSAK
jgi:outer membrane protein assembly factor BamB